MNRKRHPQQDGPEPSFKFPWPFAACSLMLLNLFSSDYSTALAQNTLDAVDLTRPSTTSPRSAPHQFLISKPKSLPFATMDTTDTTHNALSLNGSAWMLVGWQQEGIAQSLTANPNLTATFVGDRISGSGGCNQYSGTYRQQGNTLNISNLIATEMACEPAAVMIQETAFLQAIAAIDAIQTTASGQIKLSYRLELGKTGLLIFAQCAPLSPSASSSNAEEEPVDQDNSEENITQLSIQPPFAGLGDVSTPPLQDHEASF